MKEKIRRTAALFLLLCLFLAFNLSVGEKKPSLIGTNTISTAPPGAILASSVLEKLEVKGRAPKTGYERLRFLSDWGEAGSCDMRNIILKRDMNDTFINPINKCWVISGTLDDPYTGKIISFQRGAQTSGLVQIDHVVALSDAWQKGAQNLNAEVRNRFANDPLNLLAVDGKANQKKSDGDAATWLPPNKSYRCRYVARQIAVKSKYHLWVTVAEKDAIIRQLQKCPDQVMPIETAG